MKERKLIFLNYNTNIIAMKFCI